LRALAFRSGGIEQSDAHRRLRWDEADGVYRFTEQHARQTIWCDASMNIAKVWRSFTKRYGIISSIMTIATSLRRGKNIKHRSRE